MRSRTRSQTRSATCNPVSRPHVEKKANKKQNKKNYVKDTKKLSHQPTINIHEKPQINNPSSDIVECGIGDMSEKNLLGPTRTNENDENKDYVKAASKILMNSHSFKLNLNDSISEIKKVVEDEPEPKDLKVDEKLLPNESLVAPLSTRTETTVTLPEKHQIQTRADSMHELGIPTTSFIIKEENIETALRSSEIPLKSVGNRGRPTKCDKKRKDRLEKQSHETESHLSSSPKSRKSKRNLVSSTETDRKGMNEVFS